MSRALITTLLISLSCLILNQAHAAETTAVDDSNEQWKLLEVKDKKTGQIWFFRKNIGIKNFKEKNKFPTLVYFTISYIPKVKSGLPAKKDANTLYDFEEMVIPKVEKTSNSVFVASVVKAGIKDHLFYVSEPEYFLKTISKFRNNLQGLGVELEKVSDPGWNIYEDFPEDVGQSQ